MNVRRVGSSIALVASLVLAFALSAGTSSASLVDPGGGGELVSCQVLNKKVTLNQAGITPVGLTCLGNYASYSVHIIGYQNYSQCYTVGWDVQIYTAGQWDNLPWYASPTNYPYCGDGATQTSPQWPGPKSGDTGPPAGSNVEMSVQLAIQDGFDPCEIFCSEQNASTLPTTAYVTITIYKR